MNTGIKKLCFGMMFFAASMALAADSYFIDRPATAWVTDKVLVTIAPLGYQSGALGYVEVPTGFHTDLSSVPRVPLLYDMLGNRAPGSAIVHDYLYRSDSEPFATRDQADNAFLEAMESRGVACWIRWPMWAGVRVGGAWSYHKRLVDAQLF